ncbi:aspartate ammonia-lyase [Candidatus Woesearchaeota archaeon]|nr:aspartate ammonia-lyase [Candidatus Woesearchaeota archaeon]
MNHSTFSPDGNKATRIERDALGSLEIDAEAVHGIFTERAKKNFQISGIVAERNFIKALALIKKAAAAANIQLGTLDRQKGAAIIAAATEVAEGNWDSHFPLDVFQAGAGTPFNMNCNEVIANIAISRLGGKKGDYALVHPNNHVNMAQSSNDVIPTSIRIATLFSMQALKPEIARLDLEFRKKAEEYKGVVKTGRTHLEDAVPIRFDQVFNSYANALENCTGKIKASEASLLELGIGGTAVGTGINTHPEFKSKTISYLREYTSLNFAAASDSILTTWSASAFLEASSSFRLLATELIKICNDLMLLNSGPKTAIAEIILPEVEPGSSIMPGKVNPSIPECAIMACYQVLGNDNAVMEAAKSGQMELNVMTPLIAFNLLWSAKLLTNTAKMLSNHCVKHIIVDRKRSGELLHAGLSLVTALNPYLGYEVCAEIVKISATTGKTLKEAILENRLMSAEDLEKILNATAMTEPGQTDQLLKEKIQNSTTLAEFRQKLKIS